MLRGSPLPMTYIPPDPLLPSSFEKAAPSNDLLLIATFRGGCGDGSSPLFPVALLNGILDLVVYRLHLAI